MSKNSVCGSRNFADRLPGILSRFRSRSIAEEDVLLRWAVVSGVRFGQAPGGRYSSAEGII